jgi:tetratricopeptide (TPR) repeat protein
LKGHTDRADRVAFSPDGRRLISGSHDHTIKVWDVATGQELQTLRGHTGATWGVAFSPDGQWLASASQDRTVRLWDGRLLTAEVQVEREALRLVEFWLARPLSRQEVLERLRGSRAIRDEVRRHAVRRATSYRDGPQFHAASWAIARKTDEAPDRYLQALAWAQKAYKLDPANRAYRTTLGVAQYRAGQHPEVVATLAQVAQPNAPSIVRLNPIDLAALAMAHHQLGQNVEAQACLDRLRALQKARVRRDEWWEHDADVQAFIRQAEVLLRGTQP